MLEVEDLVAGYYGSQVLQGVSFHVDRGITLVIGPNGAGKSTLVRAISGTLRPVGGRIRLDGTPLEPLPAYEVAELGIATSPERARLFADLRVLDNLQIGAELAARRGQEVDFDAVLESLLEIFPEIRDKLHERAFKLSGGQQQMVAIARALAAQPKLLIMDEPTTGLHPALVKELLRKIEQIAQDLPVLLTEQNVWQTAPMARVIHLLEAGRFVFSGPPDQVLGNEDIRRSYLGAATPPTAPKDAPGGS